MTNDVKHIKPLTSIRGIAALSVVILHFSYYALPKTGVILSSHSAFFYNSYLWVDFFFILSGFIMTHVYINHFSSGVNLHKYCSYLFSRFARIYPLHIFILILFIGLEIIKIFLPNAEPFTEKFNLTALFANIFMLQAFALNCPPLFWCNTYWNEPAWSISVEFIIYFIFPSLLIKLLNNQQKDDLLIYFFSLTLLFLVTLTRGNLDSIIGIPSIARCGLECIIGIITYKVYRKGNYQKYWNNNLLTIVSLLWIFLIMNFNWDDSRLIRSIHDWIVLPGFSLLILSLSVNKNNVMTKFLKSSFIVYLGTISYSIYMIHWFIQEALKVFWFYKFNVTFGSTFNEYQSMISLGIFMVIVLCSASLIHNFIEVPGRNSLKYKFLTKQ
ncbi:Acyltransferase 3 [Trichormus variabilis ATCC 29413]|uniref:Acyltransferase 3 n=4 Tax=Anabaena variabilis TaxID=264691 RepID=Q3M3K3_TRIV2|nr:MULTISPECIES: acyltransferase [Nostocaceae]ABA24433.1 Acyltransferase 3 [Trichormus variabilis ATCC 29413]MBC1214340.1 acyltransferase [Trichormus variabilis ARAD]MBC1303870.1 acyltransferase [Trichormus variabilis N2B]MBC1309990.1 acyltransferase [Trichormus variabilis PNB]MBC1325809.1 acyltransferase [Trichormus variabilis 9RC]